MSSPESSQADARAPTAVSMGERVKAFLGGLSTIAFAVWVVAGAAHYQSLLIAAFALPVGLVLIIGSLMPGRDARVVLGAARALRGMRAPSEEGAERPATPEASSTPATPNAFDDCDAQRVAQLCLSLLAVLALLWALMAPFQLWMLCTGGTLDLAGASALVAALVVWPLLSLGKRLSR